VGLRQWLVEIRGWPAKIRRRRILPDLDDTLADRARAGELLEKRLAITFTARLGERRDVLLEATQHFPDRGLVSPGNRAPHCRVGGGDTSKIAESAGGKFQHFRTRYRLQFVGSANDGVGDQMRQMTGDGKHQVVVVRVHGVHVSAEYPPKFCEL